MSDENQSTTMPEKTDKATKESEAPLVSHGRGGKVTQSPKP